MLTRSFFSGLIGFVAIPAYAALEISPEVDAGSSVPEIYSVLATHRARFTARFPNREYFMTCAGEVTFGGRRISTVYRAILQPTQFIIVTDLNGVPQIYISDLFGKVKMVSAIIAFEQPARGESFAKISDELDRNGSQLQRSFNQITNSFLLPCANATKNAPIPELSQPP